MPLTTAEQQAMLRQVLHQRDQATAAATIDALRRAGWLREPHEAAEAHQKLADVLSEALEKHAARQEEPS
jgi:DNA-directed RNA polymerase specialized sigma54-like protein